MDLGYRSLSSLNLQSAAESFQGFRQPLTADHVEYSAFVSTLQLFLGFDEFFKRICEATPASFKLTGKIKKALISSKIDNFTGISAILPIISLFKDQTPAYILKTLLDDYRSCSEIPYEKRPDSLFDFSKADFNLKILSSQLFSNKLPDIIEEFSTANKLKEGFIVFDVIYDVPPSCEKVLQSFLSLSSIKGFELTGLVAAHGCYLSSFIKKLDQWRCMADGRVQSFLSLLWQLLVDSLYPSLLVFQRGNKSFSPSAIIEPERLLNFAKLQDETIKFTVRKPFAPKNSHGGLIKTASVKFIKKVEESPCGYHENKGVKPQRSVSAEIYKRIQINMTHKDIEKRIKDAYTLKSPSMNGDVKSISNRSETSTKPLTRSVVVKSSHSLTASPAAPAIRRNNSADPKAKSAFSQPRHNRQPKLIPAKESPRPGILKTSTSESQPSRYSSSFQSLSRLLSPKDLPWEKSLETEESTEGNKQNFWMSDKLMKLVRTDSTEKRVNFSDKVYHIEHCNSDQMPEIRIGAMKFHERKAKDTKFLKGDYRFNSESLENECWSCPKCSKLIVNSIYECIECKFINWEKFYAIKSKLNLVKSECYVVRSGEKDEPKSCRLKVEPRKIESINANVSNSWKVNQESPILEEPTRKVVKDPGFSIIKKKY